MFTACDLEYLGDTIGLSNVLRNKIHSTDRLPDILRSQQPSTSQCSHDILEIVTAETPLTLSRLKSLLQFLVSMDISLVNRQQHRTMLNDSIAIAIYLTKPLSSSASVLSMPCCLRTRNKHHRLTAGHMTTALVLGTSSPLTYTTPVAIPTTRALLILRACDQILKIIQECNGGCPVRAGFTCIVGAGTESHKHRHSTAGYW